MTRILDSYELSPLQAGMLYHALSGADRGVDIQQIVMTLPAPLDEARYLRAWQKVAERHPILRSRLRWEGLVEPVQEVLDEVVIPVESLDWRPLTPGERPERFHSLLDADRARGLDLGVAPVMRLTLVRMSEREHRVLWTFHHAFIDGRSWTNLLREVFIFYDAFARGQGIELPLPRPYRHHIEWLRALDHDGARPFWQAALAGFRAPTPLAAARERRAEEIAGSALGRHELRLPLALTSALRQRASEAGVTLGTVVHGAWALLLHRYSGANDVVFGTIHAARPSALAGAQDMVGMFINALPLRARFAPEARLDAWLQELRAQQTALREYEHTPLVKVQGWSEVPRGGPLFESVVVFDHQSVDAGLRAIGRDWSERRFDYFGQTNYPLTVYAYADAEMLLRLEYSRHRFEDGAAARMLGHLQTLLEGMAADPQARLDALPMLTQAERQRMLVEWNRTDLPCTKSACVQSQIEEQAERTPDRIALIFEDTELTYRGLNERANRLAARLIALGVGPERLVGVHVARSIEMVVAVLAVLKAGGAYVPLDPGFPAERIRHMIEDAGLAVLLTQNALRAGLGESGTPVVALDEGVLEDPALPTGNPSAAAAAASLAYVMYTSGSTGRPKGVMVEHRNVTNFFAGMDACIEHDAPGTWLAVTSLSFDISVLELLWTLARGFKVVIQGDVEHYFAPNGLQDVPLGFSLFMWGNDDAPGRDKYRLMLEGAKYFDRNGFEAVWTPERHFHAFGGPYPNPSVTGAALAAVTERIAIRAGSCVSPLHHPIRIAEEWAVVDNLSNGRVALAFASGWQPNDFVLRPQNHAESKRVMLEQIDQVRRLWRGEKLPFRSPLGKDVPVETLPRPVQPELPFWVTTAGNPETYRQAGELGANVLTHLLGQSVEEVAEKISIYRKARAAAGHDPATGRVTLMLHTFVGEDDDAVRELVRQPMKDYLRSSLKLVLDFAWSFPAFKRPGGGAEKPQDVDLRSLPESEIDALLDFAFERYFETSGLFGTPATCARMVERCKRAGVDEIACLLDFGVPTEQALASLPYLNKVRERANAKSERASLASQIVRHGVTHFQCTPSLARMLLMDDPSRAALGRLREMLVGGEALPAALARELKAAVGGALRNMYGPTETTVWSTIHTVAAGADAVPIGRPIANTRIYILDGRGRPAPAGVAGELFIGGAGVARGYLRRPEMTSERFVANPFLPGERVYRTGDLARYRDDGAIEFLGRADHQVKIRGHRVELQEIEQWLAESPAVEQAAVTLLEEARLVGYVVPSRASGKLNYEALREHLRRRLPDYMVPGELVTLERLPLTPNGKLDRKALPAPERIAAAAQFVAPATSTEQALAELWQRVLRIERIGAKDNFFDSGGHSLLAMQLVGGVRERFGVELPLKNLFARPVLADLAEAIDALSWLERSKAPPARAAEREEMLL